MGKILSTVNESAASAKDSCIQNFDLFSFTPDIIIESKKKAYSAKTEGEKGIKIAK